MQIKLFQLNIEEGKRWEDIVSYVKEHDFDILHFQEVNGGEKNSRGIETFPILKNALQYKGIQAIYWHLQEDPNTYMSNVTFFKPTCQPVSSQIVRLKPSCPVAISREVMEEPPARPTAALDVLFAFNNHPIHFINTHLVWGPTPEDEPYKLEQGKILYEYIKNLTEPFVLSGDFNLTADSQVVHWMDELGVNQTVNYGITNTLNSHLHRIKDLFPKGLAVDYLFTHPSIQTRKFKLIDSPDLSDHYGLSVELEL